MPLSQSASQPGEPESFGYGELRVARRCVWGVPLWMGQLFVVGKAICKESRTVGTEGGHPVARTFGRCPGEGAHAYADVAMTAPQTGRSGYISHLVI